MVGPPRFLTCAWPARDNGTNSQIVSLKAHDPFATSENEIKHRRPDQGPGRRSEVLLGRRVEGVDHVGRDTAASRHIVPVATGPFADRGALLAIDGTAAAA